MGDPADSVGVDSRAPAREDFHARDRAAFLAGDELDADDAKPAAKKPAPKSAPVEDEEDDAPAADDADDEAEETSAESDDADEDEDEAPKADADDDDDDADPELAKRLAQVRKTEQRLRAQLTEQRAEFQREIESWKPRIEKVEKFEALSKRAKYEPAAVLRELGLSEDDFEDAARELYAHSTKGAADPKNKEAVARSKREREMADKIAAMEKRETERAEAEKRAAHEKAAQAEADRYIGTVVKAIDAEKFPLAAAQKAKNAAKLQDRLARVAYDLAQELEALPSAKQVLKRYETIRREELEELGVDPVAVATKVKTAPKAGDKTTAKKPAAKPAPAARPSRDEILAELEAGDFD